MLKHHKGTRDHSHKKTYVPGGGKKLRAKQFLSLLQPNNGSSPLWSFPDGAEFGGVNCSQILKGHVA